jgi:biotin carboxyl carrier protein
VDVNGELTQVTVRREDERFVVNVGGRTWTVDAAMIGPHLMSLLVEKVVEAPLRPDAEPAQVPQSPATPPAAPGPADGRVMTRSREIAVGTDPVTGQLSVGLGPVPLTAAVNTRRRWGGRDDGASARSNGPQRIVSPMPGKVVRLLAKPGDRVVHRQPVVVIEAMKMENELRATRDGAVAELLVHEGQSVEAGTLLAVITSA